MQRCLECAKKEPDRPCVECRYFIQLSPLRRVPSPPVRVFLEETLVVVRVTGKAGERGED